MIQVIFGFSNKVLLKEPKAVYFLLTFLMNFSASLTFATYVLFLLSKNLDLFQVMLINLAFMVGNFILEVPTGAYADYFGRKKSVVLSNMFMVIGLLVYFSSSSILMFIVAELICALAYTFASGAIDAWVVDSLERKKFSGKVDFVFSKSNIIAQFAVLIGGLMGGYLGSINLALPFGVGAIFAFIAFITAILFMHEEVVAKKVLSIAGSTNQMIQIIKDSVTYGIKHKVVLWLIFSSILATFAFQPLNMYWSPRLNELAGNQIWLMGWVWAGISLFMMLGSFLIKKLLKEEKSYTWILILTAVILGAPIVFASFSNIFGVVLLGFLFYEIGRGMINPVHKAYINKYIPGEQRATVLSFDSMMGKLGAGLGLVILGWVAKNYSIQTSWLISGLLLFLLIPIYLRAKKHESLE